MLLLLMACAARGPAPTEPQDPALALAEALAEALTPLDRVSMARVLGHRRGEDVAVFGDGRFAEDDPRAPDGGTAFEIGSITKVFTSLMLAEASLRGALALDDPALAHLPEGWTLPEGERGPVRLVHLSTHTSGLPRMPPGMKIVDPDDPYAAFGADDLAESLTRARLDAEPGEAYAYSNLGAGLLGFALAGDGAAWCAEVEARVLAPMGLQDTGCEADPQRLAPGHDSLGKPRHAWHLDALAGAGQLRATAEDLLAFAAASWTPGPLAEAMALTQQVHHDGEDMDLGLGWHALPGEPGTWWHNGGTGGYRSLLLVNPQRQCAVVLLASTMSPAVDAAGRAAWDLLCSD